MVCADPLGKTAMVDQTEERTQSFVGAKRIQPPHGPGCRSVLSLLSTLPFQDKQVLHQHVVDDKNKQHFRDFFLALTPSDLFKQTTPQQSWPINHLNGLKTYLMSLTNHFMKCHCSSWQDFLLHTSSLFCFTLSAPRLPCACAPSVCTELWNFSVEQYSGDHLPS